jgi:pilus assembly protein CpaB
MNYSVRNIGIAVGLAVCAVVLVLVYTTNYQQKVDRGQDRIKVLVAAKEIPAGSTGEQIVSKHLLQLKEVVRSAQVPGALQSMTGRENQIVNQTVYPGQQVVAAIFQAPITQPAGVQLQGNMRAIQFSFDDDTGVVGTIAAGDHVDIFGAFKVTKPDGTEIGLTRLLLRNVLVLKTEQGETTGSNGENQHVLFAVSDLDANRLLWAKNNAVLHLVARPKAQAQDSPITVQTPDTMILQGVNAKQAKDIKKKSILSAK